MDRDFFSVVDQLVGALTPELANKLLIQIIFWAPEVKWVQLSMWVHNHIEATSSNEMSVNVYSILTDRTPEETRQLFQRSGL